MSATEAAADALFAHHETIKLAPPGTWLIAREDIDTSPTVAGGSLIMPAGTHMIVRRAASSSQTIGVEAAIANRVLALTVFADDFHKLDIRPTPESEALIRNAIDSRKRS